MKESYDNFAVKSLALFFVKVLPAYLISPNTRNNYRKSVGSPKPIYIRFSQNCISMHIILTNYCSLSRISLITLSAWVV